MRAFVTGGTGFVGSHLVERLVADGHRVTALVRSRSKAARVLADGVELIDGDLTDSGRLAEAIADHDVVFHVAGLVAARDESHFMEVNRDGTRNLINACRFARPRRLVFVSSMAASGPSRADQPLAGHERPAPVTAYGRSKLAAEELVRRAECEFTIIRPPMVYGPRDTEVLKVFKVARTGVVPLFGRRDQRLSAIYAEDLAAAIVALGEHEGVAGRTYYPCHPDTFTSEAFARAVASAIGRQRVRIVVLPPRLTRGLLSLTGAAARLSGKPSILNADKANELLQAAWTGDPALLGRDTGWRAVYALERGLSRTVAWYREHGWL